MIVSPSTVASMSADVATRVEQLARGADLAWVADVLTARRDAVLQRWLAAAKHQPFHLARPEAAIADDIPRLYDALVALLQRDQAPTIEAPSPQEDPSVLDAIQAHTRSRLAQGLIAADVVTEFRLLRQEIGRALRQDLPDRAPATDVAGAVLLVHDALDGAVFLATTALAQQEAERQALTAARQVMETERARFVASIAHDLKNPLATAKGTVQLLRRRIQRGAATPTECDGALATVEAAVDQMDGQLVELADVASDAGASAGSAPLRLNRRPVDLIALVRGAIARHQAGTERHHLRLDTNLKELSGRWDETRLARVLDNLLGNAVKYSPTGGEITVTVRCDAEWVEVCVRDQGIGIPAAQQDLIFECYQRATNVSELIPGTGVGLYAARRVVEAHGGSIALASSGEAGSTFVVRLPIDS